MWGRRTASMWRSSTALKNYSRSLFLSVSPNSNVSSIGENLLSRSHSHYTSFFSTSAAKEGVAERSKSSSLIRKAIPIVLISLTGGIALSAINDLAIFHGCSSKAILKANKNQKILEALGEPIARGPWYEASLAVGRRRQSLSLTFPVSGPQGTGIFRLKAVRSGDENLFSFLRHHDWDILIMDAVVHIPANEENNRTLRISITDRNDHDPTTIPPMECKDCSSGGGNSSSEHQSTKKK